jgi:glycosyltransferase involved in cell wall biosynthesis
LEQLIGGLPESRSNRVTLLSDFEEDLGPGLVAAGDLLVLPSGRDAFGIVFVEAWACRKPVIGVNLGATASLIQHEQDGLLVRYEDPADLANAILRLLGDPTLRTDMGLNGFRKVRESYSWSIIARRYREIYLDLIDRNEATRP